MANGIFTNSELIDSLVVDLNNVLKEQQNGQFIQACCIVSQMAQKLINLRKTIDNDLKNREETIEVLKKRLRDFGHEVIEIPAEDIIKQTNERDGVNNG